MIVCYLSIMYFEDNVCDKKIIFSLSILVSLRSTDKGTHRHPFIQPGIFVAVTCPITIVCLVFLANIKRIIHF